MKPILKVLNILAVNLFLLLLVFIILEGICRISRIPYNVKWVPDENSFAQFDGELGWSYLPNKSTVLKIGDITKPVHFDENGIRVESRDIKMENSRPSVIFVGGSFTMGHGLSFEESFAGKFKDISKSQYQVVNLGVQGYGSDQSLLALKKHLPRFNTKVVIYTFIEDHILRNGNYDRRLLVPTARFLGTKPLFALKSQNELYLSKKPVLYEKYINSWLLDFIKIKIGGKMGIFPPFPEELTKAIILEMKRYAEDNGAHFAVIIWRWRDSDYNRLFREINIDVIDTMKDPPRDWENMTLLEGIHPDEQAGDHVALLLLNYLSSATFNDKKGEE
jgi:hypothetical protein